jgi:C-terminal peptidase prc
MFISLTATFAMAQSPGIEPPARATEAIPRDGLLLHYDFAQAETGNTVTDKSGQGNHGQVTGARWISNGKTGGAYEFVADGDSIRPPNNETLNPQRITFSVWIKTSCMDGNWRRIFDKCFTQAYELHITGDWKGNRDHRGYARLNIPSKENSHFCGSDAPVTDGQWHHLAATYDGQMQYFYLDGKLQSNRAEWKGRVRSTAYGLTIGCNGSTPPSQVGQSFRGAIGELMLYGRALSANEVSLIYETQKATFPEVLPIGGLGVLLESDPAGLRMKQVYPDGSAARAGVCVGSIITAINGVDTRNMQVATAVSLIRGPVGTKVELDLLDPYGKTRHLAITRGTYTGVSCKVLRGNIGVIEAMRLPSEAVEVVRKAIAEFELQKVDAVVLDLRGTGGVRPDDAAAIAELFLPAGTPLWYTQTERNAPVGIFSSSTRPSKLPLAVLTDAKTSFYKEVIASAIQSSGRGKVVGQKTAGDGRMRNDIKRPDGTTESIKSILLIKPGEPLPDSGLEPDVKLTDEEMKGDAVTRAAQAAVAK